MRNFLKKAVKQIPKLDDAQVSKIVNLLSNEYELMEIVLDSISDGIIVADKENNILFLNKAARTMLRLYNLNDNVEHKILDVVKDLSIKNFLETYLSEKDPKIKDTNRGDKKPIITFVDTSARETKILEFKIIPLIKNSATIGNVVKIEDITEEKIQQSKLRRAESLASLTTLAAGVAHEIKNPLGSISIYLQLMEKAVDKGVSNATKSKTIKKSGLNAKGEKKVCENIKSNINIIKDEVERLNKIVMDFLFAVRPINLELLDENLNNIITETLDFFIHELEKSGITAESDLCLKLPDLQLDKRYIKQVLINLIKNAQFAMPAGGHLKIITECRNNNAVLKVSDTGIGISDSIITRIFEPYFTTKEFGSGIGLTIAYKIIKEHRGDISVKTKINKGTTFIITFPLPKQGTPLIGWCGNGDTDEILDSNS